MKQFTLTVRFDHTTGVLPDVFTHFQHMPFEYRYYRNFVPPNHIEFEFKGLSEEGLERMKARWRTINPVGGHFTVTEIFG